MIYIEYCFPPAFKNVYFFSLYNQLIYSQIFFCLECTISKKIRASLMLHLKTGWSCFQLQSALRMLGLNSTTTSAFRFWWPKRKKVEVPGWEVEKNQTHFGISISEWNGKMLIYGENKTNKLDRVTFFLNECMLNINILKIFIKRLMSCQVE